MDVGPPLAQVDSEPHGSSHMDSLTIPTPTPHGWPKGHDNMGKRVKGRKQTVLRASMCRELCLVITQYGKLFHLGPPPSALTRA